jgi:hypothetical protein
VIRGGTGPSETGPMLQINGETLRNEQDTLKINEFGTRKIKLSL